MLDIIRSDSRGHADHGWLQARHTFSFAGYHNPERMQFSSLRVINEDVVQPGKGFGTHPHNDMEIVTYVISGELEHRDSMGNGSIIRPGDMQRMTAGTGVLHSEFNPSIEDPLHLLQIWILPEKKGLEPGYEQTFVGREEKLNRWKLVGSRDGRDGSLTIHQDVDLLAGVVEAGTTLEHALDTGRKGFLQVVGGSIDCNGETLEAGDAVAVTDIARISVTAKSEAELLLFDLA
jgi:hypothetical protein